MSELSKSPVRPLSTEESGGPVAIVLAGGQAVLLRPRIHATAKKRSRPRARVFLLVRRHASPDEILRRHRDRRWH